MNKIFSLKITYITHACLLIEIKKNRSDKNLTILTDPWLIGPSWGGSVWHYPTHEFTPLNLPKPNIIFYSHGHDDHYHQETINNFPKSWKNSLILAPNFKKKWWEETLKKNFQNIKFLDHNENFIYEKTVNFQTFLNDVGDMDSSIKISTAKKTIFLQTDNLMSLHEARRISKIEKIDIAFVLPFLTGSFPGFYTWNSETLLRLGKQKIQSSINYCSKIVKNLKPKITVPYACDLGYLGEKFYINLLHAHNKKDLIKFLKKKKIKTRGIVLNPGDYIKYSSVLNIKIINKDKNTTDNLIKFANNKNKEYFAYGKKENKITKPKFNYLIYLFQKNLLRNLNKTNFFNFKVLILISDNKKTQSLFINFNNKKISLNRNINTKVNLKVNIESSKIRNLILRKYPMNFLTFHNGGYTCERANMKLTNNEKKYWSWINRLDFFI
jgi:hypothetical protein